jgi:hypothetical protein
MMNERNIPIGDKGGLPGLPGVYLYLLFNTSFASERLRLFIVFLRLALLLFFMNASQAS